MKKATIKNINDIKKIILSHNKKGYISLLRRDLWFFKHMSKRVHYIKLKKRLSKYGYELKITPSQKKNK